MAICSVLLYFLVLFFSHQEWEKICVSGEQPVIDAQLKHVYSSAICQSTLPPGITGAYGVPLIPSRGPCSPFPQERGPSRGYPIGDSVAARNPQRKPAGGRGGDHWVPIHGDHYRNQYLVPVGIGSPRKNLNLIMDTGSALTWTQCRPPVGSGYKHYRHKNRYFKTTKSSTFSPICIPEGCHYHIRYLDGSSSSGYYGRDILFVGSRYNSSNFIFGCSQNSSGYFPTADGILGLAMKGQYGDTFISQTGPTLGRTFCYCIPPPRRHYGYLLFGDGARTNCKAESSTPLIDDSDYTVNLNGITFNNEKIDIADLGRQTTFVDSGTTITRLSPLVYDELRSKFQKYMSEYSKSNVKSQEKIFDLCYYRKDYDSVRPPKIVLHFDQANVTLDPAGIVSRSSKSQICLAFAANELNENMNILGSTQMMNLNILFDVSAKKIGFGKGKCGS